MLVRTQVHPGWELLKWTMLLAVASLLTLIFAATIASASDPPGRAGEPRLLPGGIGEWASPVDAAAGQPSKANRDPSLQIWQALDATYREDYEQAVRLWSDLVMPRPLEVWKQVALGQAHLATAQIEAAQTALSHAEDLEPTNALVHYYLGVLCLEQAAQAYEWEDAIGPRTTVLVAAGPDVVPNTRSMYQLKGMMHFEDAIKFSPQLHLYMSLVPDDQPTFAEAPPTVRDLLLATRSENFVAKAHNVLGSLYLERGLLERAEQHMDGAVAGGLSAVYGYSDLARHYEDAGQHTDAMRAWLKAAQEEPAKIGPLRNAWRNLWDAVQ